MRTFSENKTQLRLSGLFNEVRQISWTCRLYVRLGPAVHYTPIVISSQVHVVTIILICLNLIRVIRS